MHTNVSVHVTFLLVSSNRSSCVYRITLFLFLMLFVFDFARFLIDFLCKYLQWRVIESHDFTNQKTGRSKKNTSIKPITNRKEIEKNIRIEFRDMIFQLMIFEMYDWLSKPHRFHELQKKNNKKRNEQKKIVALVLQQPRSINVNHVIVIVQRMCTQIPIFTFLNYA